MSSGGDTNDNDGCDERHVLLYQPVAFSKGAGSDLQHGDTCCVSHVGGTSRHDIDAHDCGRCHNQMHLMVCLSLPEKKRVYNVFGCNLASCAAHLFDTSQFSMGGGGVFSVYRHRIQQHDKDESLALEEKDEKEEPVQTKHDLNDNDWDISDDENGDTADDLEAMVAAMENMGSVTTEPKATSAGQVKDTKTRSKDTAGNFPYHELSVMVEPVVQVQEEERNGYEEDTNTGTDYGCDGDEDKIQQMLARYMQEEDDQDILMALGGGSNATGNGGGGARGGEKEERLSREDRFLFQFMDRIKRAPHQVVRYGGGSPMWSIPTPDCTNTKLTSKGHNNKKKKSNRREQVNVETTFPEIPTCPSCGSQRVFEFQLMPSLLHLLEVDSNCSAPASTNALCSIEAAFENGGMNWGTIAVYACPNGECDTTEEFCIIQDSVDGRPTRRVVAAPEDAGDDNEVCG